MPLTAAQKVLLLGSRLPDYYVAKTGNDSTGDGSKAKPWLTIDKAALSVPISGNVVVAIGPGTYQENTAALGYLRLRRTFLDWVTFESESGVASDVIIQGASGTTFNILIDTVATKYRFRNVTIKSRTAAIPAALRVSSCTDLQFINCAIVAVSDTTTRYGLSLAPATASVISNVTISSCTFTYEGSDKATGIQLSRTNAAMTLDAISVNSCVFVTSEETLWMRGATNVAVSDCTFVTTSTAHNVQLGEDGTYTIAASGTIQRCVFSGGTGHSLLIGGGTSGLIAQDNTIAGGDWGIVIKECDGAIVRRNTVTGGTAGAAYCKAATNASLTANTLSAAAGVVFQVGYNSTTSNKCQNITLTNNSLTATALASIFDWGDGTDDAGGGVCDYNTYSDQSSGNFGAVRADASVADLAELIAAWSGYDVANNDTHSVSI